MTILLQQRLRGRMSRIALFAWILTSTACLAPPEEARAQAQPTSSLTVNKVIAPDDFGPWLWGANSPSFPMTISCTDPAHPLNPPTTYTVSATVSVTNQNLNTGSAVQSGIPVGNICTVSENVTGRPTLPLTPTHQAYCGDGSTLTWVAPQYSPANGSVVIGPGTNTVTVYNQYTCYNSGYQFVAWYTEIYKAVSNPNSVVWPPTTQFNFDFTCQQGGTHTNSITGTAILAAPNGNGAIPGWSGGGYHAQTQCMISETSVVPPTFVTPNGQTCTWNPMQPVYLDIRPSPGATSYVGPITWGSQTVTGTIGNWQVPIILTNSFTCTPPPTGTLSVSKQVVNNTGGPLPSGLPFQATAQCGNSPPTPLPLIAGGPPQTVSNVALNTSCTVVELPPPPLSPSFCPAGTIPQWSTAYAPSSTVIVTGPAANVTVINTLDCVKPPLAVAKTVVNNTGNPLPSNLPFQATITCGNTPMPLPLIAGAPAQTVPNIAPNTSCTVSEMPPPLPPPSFCPAGSIPQWSTAYNPSNTITVTGSPLLVMVINTLDCVKPPLAIAKKVVNNTGGPLPSGLPFPTNVTCGNSQAPYTLIDGAVPQTVTNASPNTSCTVVEMPIPPAPSSMCSSGTVPHWSTTYAPSATVMVAGPPILVTVTNTLDCVKAPLAVAKKVVNNTGSPLPPNLPFPTNVTCGSSQTQYTLIDGAASQTVTNASLNTSCTVAEVSPLPLPPPNVCSGGNVPHWSTTYAPSATVTVTGSPISVMITNTLDCVKPPFSVAKQIVNNTGTPLPPGLPFPTTITCGSWQTSVTLIAGAAAQTINAPLNSSCTVAEAPPQLPPPGICPVGAPPHWSTTYTPSNTVTVTGSAVFVMVTNTLDCVKPASGPLVITKKVVNGTGNPLPAGMTFPVTVDCGPPILQQYTLSAPTFSQTVNGLPFGANCTIKEQVTAPPKICPAGSVALWTSQTYAPSNAVTIGSAPINVTVTNTLDCVKTGAISLIKRLNPDPLHLASTLSAFTFQLTCTMPNNQTVTTNTSGPLGTLPPVTLPVGSKCTALAEVLQPALPAGCVWSSPTISPALPVIVGTNPVVVTVVNSYKCAASLTVTKNLSPDPLGIKGTMSFPMTVTCSGAPPANLNIAGNSSAPPITGLTAGSQCSIAETLPALPKGCSWLAAHFSPALPMTLAAAGANAITVTNGYACNNVSPVVPLGQACPPPKVAGPVPGRCVCPAGTVEQGPDCVRPTVACKPPMIRGAAGACVCPAGTVQRGQGCVRAIECGPPTIPNAAGTACVCPPGTIARGKECVPVRPPGGVPGRPPDPVPR